MVNVPPPPRVHPVVRRALLGVALGAAGCPKEVIVRVRDPGPSERLPQNECRTVLHYPAGVPLAETPIRVLIDGKPMQVTTNHNGWFSVSVPAGEHVVDVLIEGFQPVRCDPSGGEGELIVLTPAAEAESPP